MIIIKTQLDCIVKCEYIYTNRITDTIAIMGMWGNSYSVVLGTYNSKDRINEVISEIENHINNCLTEKQYTNEHRANSFNWIYTMPKE